MKSKRWFLLTILSIFSILLYNGNLADVKAAEAIWGYEVKSDHTIEITDGSNFSGDVVIPEMIDGYEVSGIDEYAFERTREITSIEIPATITEIDKLAFGSCVGLKNIYVDEKNANYRSIDGVLVSEDGKELIYYPEGRQEKTYIIPESIEEIKKHAFLVTNGNMDDDFFNETECLKLIIIGENVKTIQSGAFMSRLSLQDIFIVQDNQVYRSIDGVLFSKDKTILYTYPAGRRDAEYKVPDTVIEIKDAAFWMARRLDSVIMSKNLEKLGNYPFEETSCSKLWFPKSLKTIGKNINYIKTEYIYVGPDAVADDFKTKEIYADIYYDGTKEEWNQIEGSSAYDTVNFDFCADFEKHVYQNKKQPATQQKDGEIRNGCSRCDKADVVLIPKIEKITLSASNYVYDGKVKTPTVTVLDANGTKLKKGTDYTVSYASGRKNVGKYTVTIKFKGNYSGTVKRTFTIKPTSTYITKIYGGSRSFTVKWKKRSTQVSGYQVQYSKNQEFKNTNEKTVAGYGTTSRKVSKLSGKNYYVRVRTYKNVKVNGKYTKIYSAWSDYKKVTTK